MYFKSLIACTMCILLTVFRYSVQINVFGFSITVKNVIPL